MKQMTLQEAADQAMAHLRAGMPTQAIAIFRQILNIQPDHPGVLANLAIALHSAGESKESLSLFQRVTTLQPNWAVGWTNMGVVLRDMGRADEAATAFRQAMQFGGENAIVLDKLGAVLQDLGKPQEAIPLHEKAISLQADYISAYANLANALKLCGRVGEALIAYQRALKIAPKDPALHHHYGLLLLYSGNYQDGLVEHEWRCQVKNPHPICLDFNQPRWDGGELDGQRILIHAEQAFGDTIGFVRYLPLVAARGGKVILHCRPELTRLMRDSFSIESVVSHSEPIPDFDVHCPLMSLPNMFGTRAESIPATNRYLRAQDHAISKWRERVDASESKLKVGINWAGRATLNDRRAIEPGMLEPLTDIPSVGYFSLRKAPAEDTTSGKHGLQLIDLTSDLVDFAETAAFIENLDLVITIDSAVAHLAGALGKPVWVLLPYAPDWRWMPERAESLWYPSARLFRQPVLGDWATPIAHVTQALRDLVAN